MLTLSMMTSYGDEIPPGVVDRIVQRTAAAANHAGNTLEKTPAPTAGNCAPSDFPWKGPQQRARAGVVAPEETVTAKRFPGAPDVPGTAMRHQH